MAIGKLIKHSFLLSALALLLSANAALAHDDGYCYDNIHDLTYYGFGYRTVSVENLNTAISPSGFSALPSSAMSITWGNRAIADRFVTGSEASTTLESKVLNSGKGYNTYLANSSNILLHIGYVPISVGRFNLYPVIGGGIGNVIFDIVKDEKPPAFNQILANPDRGTTISRLSLLLDFAVAADYTIALGKSTPPKGGIAIGLKAGYMHSIYSLAFKLKGEDVQGAPDINSNGFYVKLYAGYTEGIIPAILDMF